MAETGAPLRFVLQVAGQLFPASIVLLAAAAAVVWRAGDHARRQEASTSSAAGTERPNEPRRTARAAQ